MLSEARVQANRANAAKSTGPRTDRGKRISKMNAVKHGLSGKLYFANVEETRQFERITEKLNQEWKPKGTAEEFQIETMAISMVYSARRTQAEAGEIRRVTPSPFERQCNDEERINQVFLDIQSAAPGKNDSYQNYQKSKELRRTSAGLQYLTEILLDLKHAVLTDSVTPDHIRLLLQYFPVAPRGPAAEILMAMGKPDVRALLQTGVKISLTPPHKAATCKVIDHEVELLTARFNAAAETESQRYEAEELASAVPSESVAGKLMRYESHHQRMFQKALDTLRDLQEERFRREAAARKHGPVPVPSPSPEEPS